MTKMTAMPTYGESQKADDLVNLVHVCIIGDGGPTKIVQMMILSLG